MLLEKCNFRINIEIFIDYHQPQYKFQHAFRLYQIKLYLLFILVLILSKAINLNSVESTHLLYVS